MAEIHLDIIEIAIYYEHYNDKNKILNIFKTPLNYADEHEKEFIFSYPTVRKDIKKFLINQGFDTLFVELILDNTKHIHPKTVFKRIKALCTTELSKKDITLDILNYTKINCEDKYNLYKDLYGIDYYYHHEYEDECED